MTRQARQGLAGHGRAGHGRARGPRVRVTTVVDELFAEFGRAVKAGDLHATRLVVTTTSKTPRRPTRPDSDPRPSGRAGGAALNVNG